MLLCCFGIERATLSTRLLESIRRVCLKDTLCLYAMRAHFLVVLWWSANKKRGTRRLRCVCARALCNKIHATVDDHHRRAIIIRRPTSQPSKFGRDDSIVTASMFYLCLFFSSVRSFFCFFFFIPRSLTRFDCRTDCLPAKFSFSLLHTLFLFGFFLCFAARTASALQRNIAT